MPFFFTMPDSSRTPRALNRFKLLPVPISESRAKGTDSGRLSRMRKGWRRLSNWAAGTMYMKMEARPMARIMLPAVSSRIFTWPENLIP